MFIILNSGFSIIIQYNKYIELTCLRSPPEQNSIHNKGSSDVMPSSSFGNCNACTTFGCDKRCIMSTSRAHLSLWLEVIKLSTPHRHFLIADLHKQLQVKNKS